MSRMTLVMGIFAICSGAHADPVVSTDWFKNAGYGIGVHWTSLSAPSTGGNPIPYCTAVNNFDVNAFANQLSDAGAGYVIFTLSHAQWYLAFPSPKMDSILSGRTCSRDLYADLYNALNPKGIKMMFYLPSNGTAGSDDAWIAASRFNSDKAYFAQLMYDLTAEIGNRYGNRLAGWWIDNFTSGKDQNFNVPTYAARLRAGNPNRIVTFNYDGLNVETWSNSTKGAGIQDYCAGEAKTIYALPKGRYSGQGKTQWHSWSPLDDVAWVHYASSGAPAPRFSDNKAILYTKSVMNMGGVMSWNLAPYQDTMISSASMTQLRNIKAAVRSSGPTRVVDDRHPGIAYSSGWAQASHTSDHLNTSTYATAAGSTATFAFTGTFINWYGVRGSDHGKADVYIDNVLQSTVDLYRSTRADVVKLFSKTGLTNASHTLKIQVRSDKNASSSNYYVEVDALESSFPGLNTTVNYKIRNHADGKMLNGGGGTNGYPVSEWSDAASNNLVWRLLDMGNGYFKIRNVADGKVLNGGGGTNGYRVTEWSNVSSTNLEWRITELGNGYYKIVNRTDGKAISGGGGTNGSPVTEQSDVSDAKQEWWLIRQ